MNKTINESLIRDAERPLIRGVLVYILYLYRDCTCRIQIERVALIRFLHLRITFPIICVPNNDDISDQTPVTLQ